MIVSLVGNVYAQSVEMNFISNILGGIIVKTVQTCYFGNFGNTWPSPSKIKVSICKKLSCLHEKLRMQKSTLSVISFLRYYKDIANLLFWVI